MIKLGICDNNEEYINKIKIILNAWSLSQGEVIKIFEFKSARELLNRYLKLNEVFDVILLESKIKDENGIKAAKKIRRIDSGVIIIFISNYLEYIFDSFKVRAFRYILKNNMEKEIKSAMNDVLMEINNYEYFKYTYKNNINKINYNHILYFESCKRVIKVYEKNNETMGPFYEKLNVVEKQINNNIFVRCHQSFIVNVNYIKEINNKRIILINDKVIPVSASRKKDIVNIVNIDNIDKRTQT